MTLIERYLNAVRGFLPPANQDDIVRELEEDIRAQAADLQAELGRPLAPADEEALLARFGHPIRLAARYRPQRHLIGPAMFPFYWFILKIALGLALLVHVTIAVVTLATSSAVGDALARLFIFPFTVGVTVFGWVTLVFALLDLNLDQLAGAASWKDGTLPRPFAETVQSKLSLIAEIAASTIFLIWWLAMPHAPFLVFGPAATFLELSEVFHRFYPAITVLWMASLATKWTVLVYPPWARYREYASVLGNLAGLAIVLVLLRGGPLVTLIDPAAVSPGEAEAARWITLGVRVGLGVFAIVCVVELGKALLRAIVGTQRSAAR